MPDDPRVWLGDSYDSYGKELDSKKAECPNFSIATRVSLRGIMILAQRAKSNREKRCIYIYDINHTILVLLI